MPQAQTLFLALRNIFFSDVVILCLQIPEDVFLNDISYVSLNFDTTEIDGWHRDVSWKFISSSPAQ